MEKELLRLVLKYSFYEDNKGRILETMFPKELINLYRVIKDSHETVKKDLTINELKILYRAAYPTATTVHIENIFSILAELPVDISDEIAKKVLKKAYITELGRRITELGLEIVNGQPAKIKEVLSLVQAADQGKLADLEDLDPVSKDLEELLDKIDEITKWEFNLHGLRESCRGLGPGVFKAAFGRVETGKTAYGISLIAAPKGFAEQGAKCAYFANEEPAKRSQIRAVSSYTGATIQELQLDPKKYSKVYDKVRENITFYDTKGLTLYDLANHIEKHLYDVVVWDQLDKVSINGSFAREDERLGVLYSTARDICVGANCSGIALSQANAEAEGKAYLSSANMAQSRTAKAAECDILIGIGKHEAHGDYGRTLNIVKNKLTGNHTEVNCVLRPEITRYVD